MHDRIYQTTINNKFRDHTSMEDAKTACEKAGKGLVVEFRMEPNLPGCWPEQVGRSLAAWTYDGSNWKQLNIHGW